MWLSRLILQTPESERQRPRVTPLSEARVLEHFNHGPNFPFYLFHLLICSLTLSIHKIINGPLPASGDSKGQHNTVPSHRQLTADRGYFSAVSEAGLTASFKECPCWRSREKMQRCLPHWSSQPEDLCFSLSVAPAWLLIILPFFAAKWCQFSSTAPNLIFKGKALNCTATIHLLALHPSAYSSMS